MCCSHVCSQRPCHTTTSPSPPASAIQQVIITPSLFHSCVPHIFQTNDQSPSYTFRVEVGIDLVPTILPSVPSSFKQPPSNIPSTSVGVSLPISLKTLPPAHQMVITTFSFLPHHYLLHSSSVACHTARFSVFSPLPLPSLPTFPALLG